jgi:glutamate-5-semialdehyde dehydrogenase
MDKANFKVQVYAMRSGQRKLATLPAAERNRMLLAISQALKENSQRIFKANQNDMVRAREGNLSPVLLKRLLFDATKLHDSCEGIEQVATLKDPIGEVQERRLLDDGLLLERVSVPIGVIGMIFESRPDALIQIIALSLKSGNGIVLKGGSEALETNSELVAIIKEALESFSAGSSWIVHMESREEVATILKLDDVIDLLIPRGSNEFVRYIMDNTKIPVLGHADGLCAIYVDKEFEMELALKVTVDAKCQYPAVCNAVETLLVHASMAPEFLPRLKEALKPWNVRIKGDERVRAIIGCEAATEVDFKTEFLDYTMAIKVVDSYEEAVEHIASYGSHHTDAILTSNRATAQKFLREVDSADVFWNCSTRFADGFRYGLGAEVGIGTQRIHARGPVGLNGLVTSKWLLGGEGHTVATYAAGRPFKHIELENDKSELYGGE